MIDTKEIYKELDLINSIKNCVKENRIEDFQELWKKLSSETQDKYYEEILNLSSSDIIKMSIWQSSHKEFQDKHENLFNELLENNGSDLEKIKGVWQNTSPELQEKNFDNVMNRISDYATEIAFWEVTNPAIQQKFLERVIDESQGDFYKQALLLRATSIEAKKEKEDYIFKMIESFKDNVISSEKFNNQRTLIAMWGALESSLQNTEKGKNFFFGICDYCKEHIKDIKYETSTEFIENNLIEIMEIFHISYRNIRPEVVMRKENFSYLYRINNDGKEISTAVYNKIRELFNLNNDVIERIYFPFLSDENLLSKYTDEQLLRITNDPVMQIFIYENCHDKRNIALEKSIIYLINNDDNWVISLENLENNIGTRGYKVLLSNLSKVDETDINDDFSQQLLSVLSGEDNFFDINNYDDVCNYTQKRNEICEKIFNGDFEDIPETLKRMYKNNPDKMYKFALLEHQFGISLTHAEDIIKTYGSDLQELPNSDLKDYLTVLTDIVKCSNIEDIIAKVNDKIKSREIEPWQGSVDARNADSKLINMFKKIYNEVLYDPKKEEITRTETYIDHNGKEHKINIIELNHDFYMRCRVEAAWSESRDMKDFNTYYNEPTMRVHGNCESLIRQDYISLARMDDERFNKEKVIVGYAGFRKNQLANMAPYDMGSINGGFSIYNEMVVYDDTEGPVSVSNYRTPNQMINNTGGYNEMVSERYITDENGKISKLKPDFVIWIEDEVTDEPKEIGENTKRMAAELEIPIVVLNREKFLQKEFDKIEVMRRLITGEKIEEPKYQEYQGTFGTLSPSQLIKQLMITFENNRRSIKSNEVLKDKYFTLNQFKLIMDSIDEKINNMEQSSKMELLDAKIKATEFLLIDYPKDYNWKNAIREMSDKDFEIMHTLMQNRELSSDSNSKKNTLLQQYLDQGISSSFVYDVAKETEIAIKSQGEIIQEEERRR